MLPKVVVGTLTWNQKKDVIECLESVSKMDYPNFETVMVDNGSTDGTIEEVTRLFPKVSIVRNASNLGCAEGVNGEIRHAIHANADYLFIIANDAVVEPSTLSELMEVAQKDPELGMIFPKVYYYQSRKIWFAKGINLNGGVDWLRGRFQNFVQNIEDDGSCEEECDADFYPGGFCVVNMAAVRKVGLLDPRYFIYFDDTEWLVRIARAGFRGRYAPKALTWHKASSAFGMESPIFHYYRTRNRLYFYRQFSPAGYFPLFLVYFFYEFFTQTIVRLYRSGMHAQIRAALWGMGDFFRGKMGSRDFSAKKGSNRLQVAVSGVKDWILFIRKSLNAQKLNLRVSLKWNLGDEIIHLPAFEVLRQQYPQAHIEAEVSFPDLLKGNPFVDAVNTGNELRPDLTLDLRHEVRGKSRMAALKSRLNAEHLPLPKVYLSKEEIAAIRHKWNLNGKQPVVALTSSARWTSRRWKLDRWTELVHLLQDCCGARVLVLGSAGEAIPAGEDLTCKTQVRDAALILSQCDLFIGADSGLVHLALSVGTPTIGLYGPLRADYLVDARPTFLPVTAAVECQGCWSDARMKFPDHCPKIVPDCMSSISVNQVFEVAKTLLGTAKSRDSVTA